MMEFLRVTFDGPDATCLACRAYLEDDPRTCMTCRLETCPDCEGSGGDVWDGEIDCLYCMGTGLVPRFTEEAA